ncbi:ATP-binding cassette domain-containing protein|nr:ATP-binding cassette domain-containing protein [archaeon]
MIDFKKVSFTYPVGVTALRGIGFSIKSGERVGLIGQNGSGKTTLMKLCNGLLKPSKGRVLINGEDTVPQSIASLSSIVGYVFQNPDDQIFSSTIFDEVAFGPRNLGFKKKELKSSVKDSLEKVGLWKRRKSHPYDVGYNQRKLITIASILAMDTDAVILDEPTTGQDPVGKRVVTKIVKSLSEDKTFIVASHDIEFIAGTCDRVIVLDDGKLVLDDSTRRVFSKKSLLKKLGLSPPMITRVCQRVKGLKNDCLTVKEVVSGV